MARKKRKPEPQPMEEEGEEVSAGGAFEENGETKKNVEEIKEDVQEIIEEISDTSKDVEELKEDVEEIKEEIEEISQAAKTHSSIMERISNKLHLPIPSKFNVSDIAQQVVGALILSTPFTVTEEVWNLAQHLDIPRIILIISLTILFDVLLIHFSKFQNIDTSNFLTVFARLFSIIMVSYIAAGILLYTFGVIGNEITDTVWALKLIILVGLPANIGAATADILK